MAASMDVQGPEVVLLARNAFEGGTLYYVSGSTTGAPDGMYVYGNRSFYRVFFARDGEASSSVTFLNGQDVNLSRSPNPENLGDLPDPRDATDEDIRSILGGGKPVPKRNRDADTPPARPGTSPSPGTDPNRNTRRRTDAAAQTSTPTLKKEHQDAANTLAAATLTVLNDGADGKETAEPKTEAHIKKAIEDFVGTDADKTERRDLLPGLLRTIYDINFGLLEPEQRKQRASLVKELVQLGMRETGKHYMRMFKDTDPLSVEHKEAKRLYIHNGHIYFRTLFKYEYGGKKYSYLEIPLVKSTKGKFDAVVKENNIVLPGIVDDGRASVNVLMRYYHLTASPHLKASEKAYGAPDRAHQRVLEKERKNWTELGHTMINAGADVMKQTLKGSDRTRKTRLKALATKRENVVCYTGEKPRKAVRGAEKGATRADVDGRARGRLDMSRIPQGGFGGGAP